MDHFGLRGVKKKVFFTKLFMRMGATALIRRKIRIYFIAKHNLIRLPFTRFA